MSDALRERWFSDGGDDAEIAAGLVEDDMVADMVADLRFALDEWDKAKAGYVYMVEKAADEKLDGYRELASKLCAAEEQLAAAYSVQVAEKEAREECQRRLLDAEAALAAALAQRGEARAERDAALRLLPEGHACLQADRALRKARALLRDAPICTFRDEKWHAARLAFLAANPEVKP